MKVFLTTTRFVAVIGAMSFLADVSRAVDFPVRHDGEDVNAPEFRERQGLHPNHEMLFNGWGVTPAGTQVSIGDLALKMVVAPDKKTLIATHGGYNTEGVTVLDLASRKQTQFISLHEAWNGLAFSKDGLRFYVSGGDSGHIYEFSYTKGTATLERTVRVDKEHSRFLAGLAVNERTGLIYACDEANHEILALDPKTFAILAHVPVGLHPHSCLMGADHRHLYVSDWGSRSVSIVDTQSNTRVRDIPVGIRPNDMVLAPDGRLFVACSGDNTVHVIHTRSMESLEKGAGPTRRVPEGSREIISTSLYPESPEGSTPDALAVAPDGRTLFIANADNNDVVVVDISNASLSDDAPDKTESVSVVDGFIPVGWYPSALAVSPDNGTLIVANGKGLSRASFPPLVRKDGPMKIPFDHPAQTYQPTMSFIARPDTAQMAAYTEQVRRNSPYAPSQFHQAPVQSESAIPDKVGGPCPIKYVLYIIKENRTYDQLFGDFKDATGKPAGNGSLALTMYGEQVTPNHHQIARDYVLMDNLYCNSEVSVDGHSWCDAAIATDFNERSWILSYSKHGHLAGNDEMAVPSAGYLWDLCRRNGVSYKNYGEGSVRVPSINRGKWKGARDTQRVKYWIDDLHAAEKSGDLPQFTIMSLGEDHTRGTRAGEFTPFASVGSNDRALGEIVEAASHSRFWNQMAIFVIEDDAQNGPDHVDAHRTAGLVISPYCKRGYVDSTLYTTASMVRTIELVLGLPPLTQYDAAATPMFNCFLNSARVTPYEALPARVDLMARNTNKSLGAKQSARMNFREYDMAPEDELNRILWMDAKGLGVPYPTPIHGAILSR